MSVVQIHRVIRADAAELIAANLASQDYHLPWVTSFTDQAGFDHWFARGLTGPNVGLVAREIASNRVVGVVNINEIVAGAFQSAYLGYYGMLNFAGTGLMTEALRAAVGYASTSLDCIGWRQTFNLGIQHRLHLCVGWVLDRKASRHAISA
jgi:[ribosomal protein S5]-alanine N-acetyltransferase